MKIFLEQAEIEQAIKTHLETVENIDLSSRDLDIDFSVGRNPTTISAEIQLVPSGNTELVKADKSDEPVVEESEAPAFDSDFL